MFRTAAIFVCDLQKRVIPHIANSPSLLGNVMTILQCNNEYRNLIKSKAIQNNYGPIIVAEFLPHKLGKTEDAIISKIPKNHSNIFGKDIFTMYNEKLDRKLKASNIDTILLTGVQTEWCVTQTALDFQKNGYNVTVLQDATGSQSQYEHEEAIDRLKRRNIWTTTTHGWIVERLRMADHPVTKWYLKELKTKMI